MAEAFGGRAVGTAVQPCPAQAAPAPPHWIEIELVGEDERPIPWEQYELTLPDGTLVPGFLDDSGHARFDGVAAAGTCQVRFPNLDRDAWTPLATLLARGDTP